MYMVGATPCGCPALACGCTSGAGGVEPDQPCAVRSMQCERVAEPMRAVRGQGSSLPEEFHPMSSFGHE